MKSTKKRILSLLLVACMLLSVMVPAVFAEDEGVLNYYFASPGGTLTNINDSNGNINPGDEFANVGGIDDVELLVGNKWSYVTCSDDVIVTMYDHLPNKADCIQFKFTVSDDDYAVLKINVPTAGKYAVDFFGPGPGKGQNVKAKAYFVKATGDFNKDMLNGVNPTVVDSSKDNTISQPAGTMEFDAGDYYLVIERVDSGKARIGSLKLTPAASDETVEAKIGDQSFETVELALAAAAENGGTVVLQTAVTTEEAITINANVTLNLNGQVLTANGGLTCFGTVTDSKDGEGKIKGADVVLKTDDAHLVIGNDTDGYGVYAGSVVCASAKGDKAEGVKFTFGLKDAVNAYAAIETYGLEVTAGLKVDGQDVDVTPVFAETLVKEWAEQGAGYGIYVKVTGLENVQSSLVLTPTIGNLTGAAITYTAQ